MLKIEGKKFGRLTVIKFVYIKGKGSHWLCRCKCGNEKIIARNNLINGNSKSCGCLQREGVKQSNITHGMSNTGFYRIWRGIMNRCSNKNNDNYKYYGGRGITTCEQWQKFENFRDDMYESYKEHKINNKYTSINRIDNNKNYEPSNCEWATLKEQANNTRKNRFLTYNGQILTIAQWAKKLDIPNQTIYYRAKSGWTTEKILTYKYDKDKTI